MRDDFNMDRGDHVRVSPNKLNSDSDYPNLLGLIFAVVAVVIILIVFSLYKKSKLKKNGILFTGLCESGKTLIFSRLVFKKFLHTHTSIKENISDYSVKNALYKIIDIPGHERLRERYFDQFKTLAKGIVFVIDSVTIQSEIKDVAEYLYNCLIDNYVSSQTPQILVLCNKQEEVTAKGCTVIKMMLEKEMNLLRTTKTNQLESIGKTTNNAFLGKEGKDFEFSQLLPLKIDFAECSALSKDNTEDYNIQELEDWIEKLC